MRDKWDKADGPALSEAEQQEAIAGRSRVYRQVARRVLRAKLGSDSPQVENQLDDWAGEAACWAIQYVRTWKGGGSLTAGLRRHLRQRLAQEWRRRRCRDCGVSESIRNKDLAELEPLEVPLLEEHVLALADGRPGPAEAAEEEEEAERDSERFWAAIQGLRAVERDLAVWVVWEGKSIVSWAEARGGCPRREARRAKGVRKKLKEALA